MRPLRSANCWPVVQVVLLALMGLLPLTANAQTLTGTPTPSAIPATTAPAEIVDESRAQADDILFLASKRKTWLEVWGFHNYLGNDSSANVIQPRLYHTFPIGRAGAQGITRLDTSLYSNSGPRAGGNWSGSQFNPGNTRITVSAFGPEVARDLSFGGGVRLLMPTGYNNPDFSSAQWAVGPQLAMTYAPKDAGYFSFFSPSVRYMMGTTPVAPDVTLVRTLEFYPAIGFQLTPKLKLAFWDENGIDLFTRNGQWFVPADMMFTYSFDKRWAASVGGSAPEIITDSFNYYWNAYARVMYTF